jgi:hypothetical protein
VRDCNYDLQVIYDDGKVEEKRDQDVCRSGQIVFDGSQAALPADRTERKVLLLNRTPRMVRQVFLSSKEAASWGDDLLTPGGLESGADAQLTYRGEWVVDLRVVFDNNSAEERRDVDLCGHPTVMIAPGWTTMDGMPISEAAVSQTRPTASSFGVGTLALHPAWVQAMSGAGADRCAGPGLALP